MYKRQNENNETNETTEYSENVETNETNETTDTNENVETNETNETTENNETNETNENTETNESIENTESSETNESSNNETNETSNSNSNETNNSNENNETNNSNETTENNETTRQGEDISINIQRRNRRHVRTSILNTRSSDSVSCSVNNMPDLSVIQNTTISAAMSATLINRNNRRNISRFSRDGHSELFRDNSQVNSAALDNMYDEDEFGPVVPIEEIITRPRLPSILNSPPKYIDLNIRTLNNVSHTSDLPKIDYQMIEDSGNKIQSFYSLVSNSYKSTSSTEVIDSLNICNIQDMIAASAIIYQIDISDSINPIDEFFRLFDLKSSNYNTDDKEINSYIPIDINLQKRLKSKFPHIDSIKLDVCFNPNLPRSLYCNSSLRNHALEYGFNITEINSNDPYELMQLEYMISTFHHGKLPHVTNDRTAIDLDEIKDLDFDELVSYGPINGNMRAYTYQELYDIFKRYKVFQDPASDKGEYFSDRSISRLIVIVNKSRRCDESDKLFELRKNLRDICLEIKDNLKNVDEETRNFIFRYEQSSSQDKNLINDLMLIFHRLSMDMRGWSGKGPYPIREAMVNNQNEVDCRVSEAIGLLEAKVSESEKIGKEFLNLPLIKYKNGVFSKSLQSNDGLTLGQRLNIVKEGNEYDRMSSCIRLTSNWFCSSIYRYMKLIELDPQFNIEELANIG